ncbi:hypothetical protein ACWD7Y_08050 [Streptomyces drozdowiczii]
MHARTTQAWDLRPVTPADLDDTVELRAVAMRPDLVRLGRFAGSVTLRPYEAARARRVSP